MAPRKQRRFHIVLVPHPSESSLASRTDKIQRIAGALQLDSSEAVLVSAVDLLAHAVDLAEKHGKDKVKIGVLKKFAPVFPPPEKTPS